MADYENQDAGYDEGRSYDRRDRSASPRGDREDRQRSRSPNGRAPPPPPVDKRMTDIQDEEGALNPGTNLFVTGIHPRLTEQDVIQLFEKYGEVENCSIMLDPHTKESRGFGFVRMVLPDQADAAREGLQGAQIEGRTLSIEKARRGRPRTPTPGKYFGPPKRGDFGGGRGGRGGFGGRERYDDRRGYRDDYRRGPPREYGRYEDRGYGGGRRDRDDGYGGSSRIDRYESGGGGGGSGSGGSRREDGYGRDRRGGYESRGDDRGERGGDRSYGGAPARDDGARDYSSGGREYTRSGDDGYGRR